MFFYPAIDLKDGACVRLYQGEMEKATVFSNAPADQARAFEQAGAERLHVVDLNGAFAGKPVNGDSVKAILKAVSIPVQLGGGIRSIEQIDTWIAMGISRVILGTVALTNPALVEEAAKKYPGKIVVGIDAKNGFVATEGWANVSSVTAVDLAKRFESQGVAAIIYTDISRDGAMQGPNIEATRALAEAVRIPIIASGGISSLADIRAVKSLAPFGVEGMISGRALYDGAFTITEALAALSDAKISQQGVDNAQDTFDDDDPSTFGSCGSHCGCR